MEIHAVANPDEACDFNISFRRKIGATYYEIVGVERDLRQLHCLQLDQMDSTVRLRASGVSH